MAYEREKYKSKCTFKYNKAGIITSPSNDQLSIYFESTRACTAW